MPTLSRPQNISSSPEHPNPSRLRMPSLFNTLRVSIYASVFLFTIICLAMAGHFQTVLATSDLTRFVPFAIFVCSASLFIITILLGFSFFLRERNPISTRIELSCLGLLGIFWLVLGVYLVTSESQTADVECFASEADATPLDDTSSSFHTDQYQSMYRVLMAFALINAALVLISCLGLLFLAIRRHKKGDEHMWHGPVTSCAWFNDYGNSKKSILPLTLQGGRTVAGRPGGYANERRTDYPEKVYPSRSQRQQTRQTARNSSYLGSTNEFDIGGMVNPNRPR